jgi:hypothetical protein
LVSLLLGKPNLSSSGLKVEVLMVVQELQLFGTQGHERKTGVAAALVVQNLQETRRKKVLGAEP